jgi:hypothetical protein
MENPSKVVENVQVSTTFLPGGGYGIAFRVNKDTDSILSLVSSGNGEVWASVGNGTQEVGTKFTDASDLLKSVTGYFEAKKLGYTAKENG